MSKRFKSQDYFRYPRLGTKWRRPKGRQSKLRKRKGGSGMQAAIGYGTKNAEKNRINGMRFHVVRSLKDLENAQEAIVISRSLGAKKTKIVADKAKQMNIAIINKKKIRKAETREKEIAAKKETGKKIKKEKEATKKKVVEEKQQPEKQKAATATQVAGGAVKKEKEEVGA